VDGRWVYRLRTKAWPDDCGRLVDQRRGFNNVAVASPTQGRLMPFLRTLKDNQ
jgi:hypothetical protein